MYLQIWKRNVQKSINAANLLSTASTSLISRMRGTHKVNGLVACCKDYSATITTQCKRETKEQRKREDHIRINQWYTVDMLHHSIIFLVTWQNSFYFMSQLIHWLQCYFDIIYTQELPYIVHWNYESLWSIEYMIINCVDRSLSANFKCICYIYIAKSASKDKKTSF